MMRKLVVLILALILGLGLPRTLTFAQSPAHLEAKNGLTLIETSNGLGSGFAVSPTLVATACHVIKGAPVIRVHFYAARIQASGRQALCNERHDIAFIAVTVPEGTAILQFAADKSTQGESVWVWGYPLGTTIALEPSVAAGIVSATDTANGFLALDVSGAPGSSGGPVVNAEGKVLGILVGAWVVGTQGATGFKYAAPGTIAASLLSAPGAAVASLQGPDAVQPAAATIRPGDGVGPIKMGMTPAQVQDAIGLPPTQRYPSGWQIWETRKLAVYFDNGKAMMIDIEDAAAVTAEGIRIGSADTDLIKAYGAPVCSSVQQFRGKAYLGWYYEGLFVFLQGSPRQAFAIRVLPNGIAAAVCR